MNSKIFVVRPGITAAVVNKALKAREAKDRKNERARLARAEAKRLEAEAQIAANIAAEAAKPLPIRRAALINSLMEKDGKTYGQAVTLADRMLKAEQPAKIQA